MKVELKSFPMPPSDNGLKTPIYVGGKPRMIKSRDYHDFETEARIWMMKNDEQIEKARQLIQKTGPGWALKVDRVYWFHRDTVVRKTASKKTGARIGEPKQNDTFNRIKALHDALAQILGIDDKWFWAGETHKKILKHIAFPECVDVTLSLVDMMAD